MENSIHTGHRERLRQIYEQSGADGMSDINLLEMLMFYAFPRGDTNPLAHRLIDHFGSLSGVLTGSLDGLRQVPGVSTRSAILIRLVYDLMRRCTMAQASAAIVNSTESAATFLAPYFMGQRDELAYLLCLDAKGKLLGCRPLGSGTIGSVVLSIRKIVELSLALNASAVILAHNHPSGVALPSQEDTNATVQIQAALKPLEIALLDHLIFSEDDYISLLQSGLYLPNAYTETVR